VQCIIARLNLNFTQAGQTLVRRCIVRLYSAASDRSFVSNVETRLDAARSICGGLFDAFRAVLADKRIDEASKALVISLPTASELISLIPSCDPHAIHLVFELLISSLARELRPELEAVVTQHGGSSRFARWAKIQHFFKVVTNQQIRVHS
jgi:hypothetical protein